MADIPIINAPTATKPIDFLAVIGKYGGISKANKFVTRINPPMSLLSTIDGIGHIFRDMEFLCESSQLPGRTLTTTEARYYGPNQKFPYQSVYTDLDLTFVCRAELYEKDLFDTWLQLINPVASFDFRYKDNYATTIEVIQFSELPVEGTNNHKPVYQVFFENAFPTNINPLPLIWADDSHHRITVSFSYDRWYRNGEVPEKLISNLI